MGGDVLRSEEETFLDVSAALRRGIVKSKVTLRSGVARGGSVNFVCCFGEEVEWCCVICGGVNGVQIGYM